MQDLNTFRKNLPDFLIPKVKDWLLEVKSLMNPPPPVVLLPDLVMLDPSLGPDTTATRTMPDNFAPDHATPDHTAPDPTEPDGTQPDRPEPDTTMREDTMPEAPEKTPDQVPWLETLNFTYLFDETCFTLPTFPTFFA